MSRIELVIFDMDGLMFDTENVTMRAFFEVTKEKGIPGTRDQYMKILGMARADTIESYKEFYGQKVDPDRLYEEVGERLNRIHQEEGLPIKKGLYEILDVLDALGLKKAVASGSDLHVIDYNLDCAGIRHRFDLVSSSAGLRGKPFPDVFLNVCTQLASKPERTLILEDSPKGVEAALAGGMPVIQIPDILELSEDVRKRCLAVCPSLLEAIPILRELVLDETCHTSK